MLLSVFPKLIALNNCRCNTVALMVFTAAVGASSHSVPALNWPHLASVWALTLGCVLE